MRHSRGAIKSALLTADACFDMPRLLDTERSTRVLLALVLIVGGLVLVGCVSGPELASSDQVPPVETVLSSPESDEAAVLLAAAAAKTSAATSAKLSLLMSMGLPGTPKSAEVSMDGSFDLKQQRGRLVFDHAGLIEALGSDAEQVSPFLPDVMIFDGQTVYLRMPDLSRLVSDAKPWVRADSDELDQQSGLGVAGIDQLGQADPTQLVTLIGALGGPIDDLGVERVRGQNATHYRASVDLSKLASPVPEDQRQTLDSQLEELRAYGLNSVPIDVWVDEDGRVVRMRSTFAVPDGAGGGERVSWDVTFYDFDAPVTIKTPAKRRTAELDEVLGAVALGE